MNATGEEFIAACVVGYEVGCRVGEYLGKSHYEVCSLSTENAHVHSRFTFFELELTQHSVSTLLLQAVLLELQQQQLTC